jgi:hypothetical protein
MTSPLSSHSSRLAFLRWASHTLIHWPKDGLRVMALERTTTQSTGAEGTIEYTTGPIHCPTPSTYAWPTTRLEAPAR